MNMLSGIKQKSVNGSFFILNPPKIDIRMELVSIMKILRGKWDWIFPKIKSR